MWRCGFSLAGFGLKRRVIPPHNDVTVSPRRGRRAERPGYAVRSATQSPTGSRLRSVTVRRAPCTPPPPRCPLKWSGCGWFLKRPLVLGDHAKGFGGGRLAANKSISIPSLVSLYTFAKRLSMSRFYSPSPVHVPHSPPFPTPRSCYGFSSITAVHMAKR